MNEKKLPLLIKILFLGTTIYSTIAIVNHTVDIWNTYTKYYNFDMFSWYDLAIITVYLIISFGAFFVFKQKKWAPFVFLSGLILSYVAKETLSNGFAHQGVKTYASFLFWVVTFSYYSEYFFKNINEKAVKKWVKIFLVGLFSLLTIYLLNMKLIYGTIKLDTNQTIYFSGASSHCEKNIYLGRFYDGVFDSDYYLCFGKETIEFF